MTNIGPAAASAGCYPISEYSATGSQEHVRVGSKITYDRNPPDSGPHYANAAPFSKHFYAMADRPAVEVLVHNLEHGYAVVWYRDGAPSEEIDNLSRIAGSFGEDGPAGKFIAAPWAVSDGPGFPVGKNVVLTRWTADPNSPTDASQQKGVRQACIHVSGAAVADFMAKYPVANSPEPNGS